MLFVQCTSAPALTSAIAVSVWPLFDAACSAVLLHSHYSHSCSSTPSGRTVRPRNVTQHPQQDAAREPHPSLVLNCTSAPALTSAIAVSVRPLSDAMCSAVNLHSQSSHSCRSVPIGRTVHPRNVTP